ncbi:MAG: hypothetical protein IV090_24530 [Candidatus Sericytochromatia bacterium]|nr:hypothetical protein [Candidatus Sericytochromatia bacterium]
MSSKTSLKKKPSPPQFHFSPIELKYLLTAYYSGDLEQSDHNDELHNPSSPSRIRPALAVTTGQSLINIVTFGQLHSIILQLQDESVTVSFLSRKGWHAYALQCWVGRGLLARAAMLTEAEEPEYLPEVTDEHKAKALKRLAKLLHDQVLNK